jgi:WD40 repeat protein
MIYKVGAFLAYTIVTFFPAVSADLAITKTQTETTTVRICQGNIVICNKTTSKSIFELDDQDPDAQATLSSCKEYLVTQSSKKTAIYNVAKGGQCELILEPYRHDIFFCKDGDLLLTISLDNKVLLSDLSRKKSFGEIFDHQDKINSVCFNSDGDHIITTSDDKMIRLYNTKGCELLMDFNSNCSQPPFLASMSTDNEFILVSYRDHIALWIHKEMRAIAFKNEWLGWVKFACFEPNSSKIIRVDGENISGRFDVDTRRWKWTLNL